jgi:hypothetical protein
VDNGPFLIALAVSFGLMLVGTVVGGVLRSRSDNTIKQRTTRRTLVIKLFYLVLFGVMGFSLVPVVMHLFISMQNTIGNNDLALIYWLGANETSLVYCVWGLFVAGLAIALPAAIKDGLLK